MTPKRILVVEDDADQRSLVADLLRTEGYDVVEAESAEAALELLQSNRFDLIVTDYQLGGATGTWLAWLASRSMGPTSTQALLITAHRQIPDAEGLTVLHKPLDPNRFLSEVAQALADRPPSLGERRGPRQRIAFILYVNETLPSLRAMRALETVLSEFDQSQVALTIVDLSKQTNHQAEEHRVVVTPTLLKTFPAPRVWIAGGFDEHTVVKRLLEQAGVEARK